MLIKMIALGLVLFVQTAIAGDTMPTQLVVGDFLWESLPVAGEAKSDFQAMVSLEEFRAATLRESEVFISAWPGPEHCSVLAVTQKECLMLNLSDEGELQPVLIQLHHLASTAGSDQGELESAMKQVSDLVLAELNLNWNSFSQITYAPMGLFNLIPISLLLSDYPDIAMMQIPSVSSLVNLRKTAATREVVKSPRILAVAGVVHADSPDAPLAFHELEDLDSTYSGVTVVRPNAGTMAPELNKLLGFDIVHVGAQCISDDANPLLSAIALDPSNPGMMIRASALQGVRLDTRLVVLSRCSMANEGDPTGEGLQSLTGSFLDAGVQALVVAMWEVAEEPAGFFLNSFYEGLAQGEDAARAMALARKKCQEDAEFNKPHYWSAFVLAGDGQVKIPLQAGTQFDGMMRPMVLLAGVGAGLLFVLKMRRCG